MATSKKTTEPAAKKSPAATQTSAATPAATAAPARKAATKSGSVPKTTAKAPAKTAATAALKPIKDALNKTGLVAHLAEHSSVDPKSVKAVLAALESAMLASLHKKGHGEFTLHGLLKISAATVPAKKKRFGKDPFTGQERWFAAKPASTKIKTRALKKLKDAVV